MRKIFPGSKDLSQYPEKQQQSLVEEFGLTRGFFREFGDAIIGLITTVAYLAALPFIFAVSLLESMTNSVVYMRRRFGIKKHGAKVSKAQHPKKHQKSLVERFGLTIWFFCEFGKSIITIIVMVVYLAALPIVFAISGLKAVVDKAVSFCKSFGAKKTEAGVDQSATPADKNDLKAQQGKQQSAGVLGAESGPAASSKQAKSNGFLSRFGF